MVTQIRMPLAVLSFATALSIFAQPATARMSGDFKGEVKERVVWTFRPAINLGVNNPLVGYNDHGAMGKAGADLYIHRDSEYHDGWSENLSLRLSFDYFPMAVPEGVNGV